ncbi:hypothetical protein COCON_G00023990 [Conger conger]|uniref:Fibrinogen C-terminal domain-containing protein n=1 Tax=Conger conger TaxID=82655 RepID=A0A9Q1DXD8_CONCO|nr:hypothetical protein COCON_G00023990 [Conger conger]
MMVSVFLLVLISIPTIVARTRATPHTVKEIVAQPLPEDCDDVFRNGSTHSGVYTVYPRGYNQAVQVYCEMDCENDEHKGAWTVLQRRMDGSVNFYQPWKQYQTGFGNISGEHWLGLDHIFAFSWQKKYMLMVEMEDFEGGRVHACYDSFSIDPESDGYRLHIGKYIDGGAGDDLIASNGRTFSTFDFGDYRYNAERYNGGFWFTYHVYANPNGLYKWGRHSYRDTGVIWRFWKGSSYSMKSITMKIKPLSLEDIRSSNPIHIHN